MYVLSLFPGLYGATVGLSSCEQSPAGFFSNVTGLSIVHPCDAGAFNPISGQTVCTTCPWSSFCNVTGLTAFWRCAPGSYGPLTGQTSCLVCPAGTWCPGNTSFVTNCSSGTWLSTTGASAPSTCVQCAAGHANALTGQTAISACATCPTGTYALASSSTCTACAAGSYAPSAGMSACLPINTTLFFAGYDSGAPFYITCNAAALQTGNANGCTQLQIVNAFTSAYYQTLNGLCTNVWNFSVTTLAGPHWVSETCSDPSVAGSVFNYWVTLSGGQFIFNLTDTGGVASGNVFTWASGCTLVPPSSFVGYWRPDADNGMHASAGGFLLSCNSFSCLFQS